MDNYILQTDLQYIKNKSTSTVNELIILRKQLAPIPSPEVDKEVSTIAMQVEQNIDCKQCANCCKTLHPDVEESEINAMANALQLNDNEFSKHYLSSDDKQSPNKFFKQSPCALLKNNKCIVYAQRPRSCAEFPYLHSPHFKLRFKRITQFYGTCPIVYNTIEILKAKYNS